MFYDWGRKRRVIGKNGLAIWQTTWYYMILYFFFQSWTRKGALHGKQFWEKIQKLWAHTELIPPQEEMYNTGARRASTFSYIIQTLGTLDKSWDINSTICISYFLFGLLKQLVEAKLFLCAGKKVCKTEGSICMVTEGSKMSSHRKGSRCSALFLWTSVVASILTQIYLRRKP